MKRTLIIFGVFLICISSANSQDIIHSKNGSKIICRIVREDSTTVYFNARLNDRYTSTFLKKTDIDSIEYVTNTPLYKEKIEKASIGLGIGLDHGGLGGNLTIYANYNLAVFGAMGWAIAGPGYNAGLKIRLVSKSHTSGLYPYLLGMYGYNAAVKILGTKEYDRLFNGPSFGLGIDVRRKPGKIGYFTMTLIVPVRDSEAGKYVQRMENMGVKFSNKLYPVAFSFGYQIIINH